MGRGRFLTSLALVAAMVGGPAVAQQPPAPKEYEQRFLLPGSWFHGVHGLAFNKDDQLFAGSVIGQTLYRVQVDTGEVDRVIDPPMGMADDIAFAEDGTMAWTAFLLGKVYVRRPHGKTIEVAHGMSGPNSLAFGKDNRLFVSEVFLGDALYEIDINGPLWFKNAIVKVDPKDGKDTVVAGGFQVPAAANFGPDGNLYAIDTKTGEVKKIDMKTKAVSVIATLPPSLDNLAIAPDGTIYVSNMAEASIFAVNPATGEVRTVVSGPLATPTDIVLTEGPEGEKLHVADVFAYRVIDTASKQITDPLRMYRDETENQLGIGAGKSKVLITSWAAGAVQVVDRATGAAVMYHGFAAPTDALELADGRLVALEAASGGISEVTEGAGPRTPLIQGLKFPVSMAEAADGKLYVTQSDGTVVRVDLAAKTIEPVAKDLEGPEGIDIGEDGKLYVAEAKAGRLVSIDPKDGAKTVLAEGLKTSTK